MRARFASLDRQTVLEVDYDEPDRYRELDRLPADRPLIARGAGLSYVAASFGSGALSLGMRRFDRLLALDLQGRTATVEAGMPVGRLFRILTPHGLALPVQPGHPAITVGGCIACNIHGKNQFREGTFRSVVEEIVLQHPLRGRLVLSPEREPELFELTVGGFGLTGVIVQARLRLARLEASAVHQVLHPVRSLAETVARLEEGKDAEDLLYSWNDLSRRDAGWGAGFMIAGRYAGDGPPQASPRPAGLDPSRPHPLRRVAVMRPSTIGGVNRLFRALELRRRERLLGLWDFVYPAASKGYYFNLFGEAGFFEHQVLVPAAAWESYARALERLARTGRAPIALASIKLFRGTPSLLRYEGDGYSLSLDVLADAAGRAFLAELDRIDCDHGARANLCKDSRLPAAVARRQYPDWETVRAALSRWRGGGVGGAGGSHLARRLEL